MQISFVNNVFGIITDSHIGQIYQDETKSQKISPIFLKPEFKLSKPVVVVYPTKSLDT